MGGKSRSAAEANAGPNGRRPRGARSALRQLIGREEVVKSNKPKPGKGKSSKKKAKKEVKEVNILSPSAMLNAYYICHNAPACLEFRGFFWPGSPKKKGKKRK